MPAIGRRAAKRDGNESEIVEALEMAGAYTVCFELPPSLNRLYRTGKGRVYLSDEGRAYKERVSLLARSQIENGAPLSGEIGVNIHFYGSRMDIDNATKALFDSLNGIVWKDDAQIVELHIYKLPKGSDKRVHLHAWRVV